MTPSETPPTAVVLSPAPAANAVAVVVPSAFVGVPLLLVAAVVWGLAFVPQKWTVDALPPLWATTVRFGMAAPVAFLLAGRRLRAPGVSPVTAAGLGLLLFVVYVMQTAALQYTPVARVSLITGLYAVFVPLLAPLFGHPRPTRWHWLAAVVAFVGLVGLTGAVFDDDVLQAPLNIGDLLVLVHAVLGAVQILLVARLAKTADPYALNALQLCALFIVALPAALYFEGPRDLSVVLEARTFLAFAYLAVFSTVVAFTCQIIGQRTTSPATASVVMLLETPIGVWGGVWAFSEDMARAQWVGGLVLLVGVVLSLRAELTRRVPPG